MTPPRVVRRRRTGLIAALAAVLFLAGLLGVERRDDAWLLQVAGRSMDARGFLWVAWQNAWRGCAPLKRLQPHDPQVLPALEALREFSPPDSRSAVVLQADAWPGGWFVLQAQFDALEPVVVLVRESDGRAQVLPEGVWSSNTRPWNSAWRVRTFLAARATQAPSGLIPCIDPLPLFYQPPRSPG
ncbi:MAG: hypothetical protein ACOVOZ_07880 [Burkholderiaceae bacterium]|jgi:hypothetical protein